jgi:hypothetical protein
MTFTDFKEKVIKWAKERRIIPNSNNEAQYIKLVEELGELALAIRKQDKEAIKDAIGDIAVVLVVLAGLNEIDNQIERLDYTFEAPAFENIAWNIGKLGNLIANYACFDYDRISAIIEIVLEFLDALSLDLLGIDLEDCCESAWNEIKDRKGYLREDGIFIKKEDNVKN